MYLISDAALITYNNLTNVPSRSSLNPGAVHELTPIAIILRNICLKVKHTRSGRGDAGSARDSLDELVPRQAVDALW